jgi:hypothetical protein
MNEKLLSENFIFVISMRTSAFLSKRSAVMYLLVNIDVILVSRHGSGAK